MPAQDPVARHAFPGRFEFLDAIRGYAAFAVVIYHLRHFFGDRLPVGSGYLAVDLFFMMSGFVLALSYGERLRTGSLSLAGFLRRRILRLWPAYLCGVALGAVVAVVVGFLGLPEVAPMRLLGGALWSLLLLPDWIVNAPGGEAFPFDPPAWSLFFEFWGNLAYAILAVRIGTRWLAISVGLAFVAYVLAAALTGTVELGVGRAHLWLGPARFWFGFGMGVLIWRLRSGGGAQIGGLADYRIALVVLALAFPAVPDSLLLRFLWIGAVIPLGVIAALDLAPKGRFATLCHWLGQLSYPLYLMHWPVLVLVVNGTAGAGVWQGIVVVLLSLGLAVLVALRAEPALRAGLARLIPSR